MGKLSSNVLAGLLGVSATLGNLAASAPCNGGGCHSCYGCAGVGLAVIAAAVCCRGRRPTAAATEPAETLPPAASPAAAAGSPER
jgi:hypothetical protein